jgi:hypothetical protein
MDTGSKGNAAKHPTQVAALAISLLEREGKTQMRRMLKEAVYAEGEYGGLLSALHTVARLGAANTAVVSRTTGPLSTTIT